MLGLSNVLRSSHSNMGFSVHVQSARLLPTKLGSGSQLVGASKNDFQEGWDPHAHPSSFTN